jgi:integrase
MKRPAIPGIKRYFEPKSGKWYCYHRKSGERIKAEYGTPEFIAEVAQINATAAAKVKIPENATTLGELIVKYRAVEFERLAPRTRADYQKIFDYLKPISHLRLDSFTPGGVVKLRDKAFAKRKRHFANYLLTILSVLFEFAREREYVTTNPVIRTVKKIRKPRGEKIANRPWTDTERRNVLAAAPIHLALPIAMSAYLGLREGDVLRATTQNYDGECFEMKTGKAGVMVWWRVPKELKRLLDARLRNPKYPHLCISTRLKPWSESGFRASWAKLRISLEKAGKVGKGLTIHGLRHTVGTYLREEGFDPRAIADALGQKQEGMALHYSKTADMRKVMEEVSAAVDRQDSVKRA